MLRDVRHNISDGLLGFKTATGDGLHIKIGVSPVTSDKPITVMGSMDADRIKSVLGLSPLADAAMDSVQAGAGRIFCIPVAASTAGTIGTVTHTGDGAGKLTVDGSPTNGFSVIVKITAQGTFNTAAFTVSIDGGYKYSDEITMPVTGEYAVTGTGLTIKFIEAGDEEQKASSFIIGDTYSFSTTAPTMTNNDVLKAIDKIKTFNQEFEFAHIVGASSLPLWQAVSVAQQELMNIYHKPAFFLLEATAPMNNTMDLTEWINQMEADRKKIGNTDIQIVAAWGRLVKLDATTQIVNLAGVVSGLYAKASVQTSIGKTRVEADFGIAKTQLLELLPTTMDNSVIEKLDVNGYLTFREYDGMDRYYVYHTKMMSPSGSDYSYAEDVRVRNKIIRETRKEGLLFLNDDIDLEDIQGELDARAKFLSAPLDRMVDDKEISSYEIAVDESCYETFPKDETLSVIIRYLSRGYIREVIIDLGRSALSTG